MVPTGAIFGSLLGIWLVKYGRRQAMIIVDCFSVIGLIICLFAIADLSYAWLLIGRFICGLNAGANSMLVPLYIKEMAPHAISERTNNSNIIPLYTENPTTKECSGTTGVFN